MTAGRTTDAWLAAEADRLLSFGRDPFHPAGGCGVLDEVGVVDVSQPSYLWITGRMLHVRSLAVLLGREQDRPLAERLVTEMAGPLRDPLDRGWFSGLAPDGEPLNAGAKSGYDHAFVLLGAATATLAGIPGARELATAGAEIFDRWFWDEDEGLCVDGWSRGFDELDPYRGANATMHAVEAMLALSEIDDSRPWAERAGRALARMVGLAAAHDWRLPEHFDADWRPLLEFNRDRPADPFKPYGATVGHGLEWARLALHVEAALGDSAPDGLLEAAVALFDRAVADGWDVDGAPGFIYTTDWTGAAVVRARMHWVVCEAIAAAAVLGARTGEARYDELAQGWWDYAREFLIDSERGSWHHELDPQNRPHAGTWAGKPDLYHAVQTVLLPRIGVGASIAGVLAREGLR